MNLSNGETRIERQLLLISVDSVPDSVVETEIN